MTDDQSPPRKFRPFEDGHALTYTIREVYDAGREFQSQHHDSAAAAAAFVFACEQARCVELRDTEGSIIACYTSGPKLRTAQDGAAAQGSP